MICHTLQDLDKYKDEWQSVMDNIESIQAIVDGFHTRCVDAGKQEDELPEHLRKAFRTLERYVHTQPSLRTASKKMSDAFQLHD